MNKQILLGIACALLCDCIRAETTYVRERTRAADSTSSNDSADTDSRATTDANATWNVKHVGAWVTVPLADAQCSANADCAAVPAGSVCGHWTYEPIRADLALAHLGRWDALAKECDEEGFGPVPPVASRCSRHTNQCILSQRLDYTCAETSLSGAGTLALGAIPTHPAVEKGCHVLSDMPGQDTYFSFLAETDGFHTFTVKTSEGPVGLQTLVDDCVTEANSCLRCDTAPCDTKRWLRAHDTLVMLARNCVGSCSIEVSVEPTGPRGRG